MTISGDNSFPSRLTKIDESSRHHHSFLNEGDECLFFGDYSARRGFAHSPTNQLIFNFKKPMRMQNSPGWHYKNRAINETAAAFSKILGPRLANITLVPVPPSKLKTDPDYDDRMMDMLRALQAPPGIIPDIRELIVQTQPMQASHESDSRPRPAELEVAYEVDEALIQPYPTWIGVIDDVLTTGSHFRAVSNVLKNRFPAARITGLFIARRVPEAIDWSELFSPIDE